MMQSGILLKVFIVLAVFGIVNGCQPVKNKQFKPGVATLRAPAYPLITIDPYISAWSFTDNLFDGPVRHWTGTTHSIIGAIRVDGQVYRFMGKEDIPWQSIVAMGKDKPWEGRYTIKAPDKDWFRNDFDDSSWKKGLAAFGTPETGFTLTPWETEHIWVRREFYIDQLPDKELYLVFSHDDDFELYLNGKEVVNTGQSAKSNVVVKIDRSLFKEGENNVFAAHCWDRGGLSYVDFGVYTDSDQQEIFPKMAIQTNVSLSATQTNYSFVCGPVNLDLTFISPLLANNLDLLSRPVNYLTYNVQSNDGKKHDVQIYFETTPEWAVDQFPQEVIVEIEKNEDLTFFKAGTTEQSILGKSGDDRRIDWGYFYFGGKSQNKTGFTIGDYFDIKQNFVTSGTVDGIGSNTFKGKMTDGIPAMACIRQLGDVSSKPLSGNILIGYDDIYAIQYFGDNRMAWWKKEGKVSIEDALLSANNQFLEIKKACDDFDAQLWNDALAAGGEKYAELCALAYRQSVAAHKLVNDKDGNTLFLSKENFSNGSIGTVDVTYPSAPLYLKYNPELLKGMLNPIFYYSESGRWTKPFAAHDVGTYPLANGQTYGGDMPVEESGNMLILTAAIAKVEGNAKYAERHWEVLTNWANYLLEHGLDPDNQLCTDDFAGHFAHNTNLSIKAIMGIASYGMLAKMLGKNEIAERYTQEAKAMAREWVQMASDGDHFRLTFDQPGTWSQKYNLVWDKLLGFNVFPEGVAQKEIVWYLTKQNKYGLPLDNRRTYTKSDWIVWTATLANDKETFQLFIDPIYKFVTETPNRVPMTDWYETTDATQVGFQARSVVGGYFIKLLDSQ